MSYLHTFAGAAWVFVAFTAVSTAAAKLWLRGRIAGLKSARAFDAPDVTIGLLLPAFVPLLWLTSAVAHLGGGGLGAVCRQWFLEAGSVWSPIVFFAALIGVGLYQLLAAYRRWGDRPDLHVEAESDALQRRVSRVCAAHPELRSMAPEVRIVECARGFCAVRGLISPTIEVSAQLVQRLDDEALRAALLHEVAHVRHNDPLVLLAASVARVVNPFSRWLDSEFRAWRFAREVQCDRAVVDAGVDGVHLADALVKSARAKGRCPAGGVHLSGCETTGFEARVNLLLHSREHSGHRCRTGELRIMVVPLVLALLAPHALGGALLQAHAVVELLIV